MPELVEVEIRQSYGLTGTVKAMSVSSPRCIMKDLWHVKLG